MFKKCFFALGLSVAAACSGVAQVHNMPLTITSPDLDITLFVDPADEWRACTAEEIAVTGLTYPVQSQAYPVLVCFYSSRPLAEVIGNMERAIKADGWRTQKLMPGLHSFKKKIDGKTFALDLFAVHPDRYLDRVEVVGSGAVFISLGPSDFSVDD